MRALLRLVAAASSCAHVEPQANDMIRCSAAGDVPDSLHAAVAQAGLLSVKLLGAVGDGVADDSGAVQRAVQCVFYTGGAVFFPPGWYHFNRTVSLFEDPAPNFFGNRSMHGKGVVLRGSNSPRTGVNAAGVKMPPDVSFTLVPQTIISGPVEGPAFRIGAADTGASKLRIHGEVRMENLGIRGTEVAVTAFNAANLRFINCGFAAHHNTSSPDNAAVIITNAFVYYFEHCSFQGPLMAADAAAPWQPGAADRKPSLLIRADQGGPHPPLRNNWIARFSNCEWGPGAIRWEQRANDSSAVGGVFEFDTVVVEDTGAPFLELCTAPNVTTFLGWEAISIRNYQNADARPRQWTNNEQPIVSIDCPDVTLGGTSCVLSNLIIDGAQQGVGGHPAVRVVRGAVHGVTLNNPSFDGATDDRSLDDVPAGEYVSRSAGGWTFVGPGPLPKHAASAGLLGNGAHALLIGKSGERNARWAVDHDGAMHWGLGGAAEQFSATLSTRRTATDSWPALKLEPGAAHAGHIALAGAAPADVCTCSHDGLGDAIVQLSCHVSKEGMVLIVLRNAAGSEAAQVSAGQVLVVVSRFS